MKAVTIHVEEDVYEAFKKRARETGQTAAAIIREAMADYKMKRMKPKHSLLDHKPSSVGGVLKPLSPNDDILGEMIDAKRS